MVAWVTIFGPQMCAGKGPGIKNQSLSKMVSLIKWIMDETQNMLRHFQ